MPLRNETLYEPVPSLAFDTDPPTPFDFLQGRLYWDNVDKTLALQLDGGDEPVTLQIGQEALVNVWNDTGNDIANASAGYGNGAVGYRPTVALAKADNILTCSVQGMATQTIVKNTEGRAAMWGIIRDMDTQTPGWEEGDLLYLSVSTAGELQNTPPSSGYCIVVGRVLRKHPSEGMIFLFPRPVPAFGNLAGGNYTDFEYDGTMKAVGDARAWVDDNFSPLSALGASAPDLISLDSTSIQIAAFDGGATLEQVSAHRELQHDYADGTDLTVHVHWMPVNANAGNVEWFCDYYIREGDTVLASGTLSAVQAAPGAAWQEQRLDIGTITGTDLVIGAQIALRLYRDPNGVSGNDTYGSDAAVATFGYHYQVDTLGSRTITAK